MATVTDSEILLKTARKNKRRIIVPCCSLCGKRLKFYRTAMTGPLGTLAMYDN